MQTSDETQPTSTIDINVECAPKISLALQQNAVPVLRDITINNTSQDSLSDVVLSVSSEPNFFASRTWSINHISSENEISIRDIKLNLNAQFFHELVESVPGKILFSLKKEDDIISKVECEVRLLTKDEWGGIGDLPEIITAFVQPNDPAVLKVLRDASKRLESAGHQKSLEGYQSKNPRRIATIVAAIYSAVSKLDLTYAVPPAGFETHGQKIRLPRQIFETRLATCLDLALLFSSCLEGAGLNSVIILTKDHAFVSVWLNEEDFSNSIIEDCQAIRKRVVLNEMLAFETTTVTNKPVLPFKLSVMEGVSKLENDEEFQIGIDISRSRLARIRPLSDQSLVSDTQVDIEIDEIEVPIDIPDGLPDEDPTPETERSPETPEGRVEQWLRKLLDLSLRNPLLNYKASKRVIKVLCHSSGLLEDKLADGVKFKILSADTLTRDSDPRSDELHKQQRLELLNEEKLNRALDKGELYTKSSKDNTYGSLTELYRVARNAIQEGGANILYLAIGFLHWTQRSKSDRQLKAPLILIPIELERKSVNSGFKISLHEDEPRFNPTLIQMLKNDFGLHLPFFDELPKDEHGLDIDFILETVRREVRDIEGWEVKEDIVLSTFSFAKFLMWKDLRDRLDLLKESSVVKHLIDTPRDGYKGNSGEFPSPSILDTYKAPKNTYTPLISDASQLAAVFAAADGKDFVLEGPPGTGKSQTIANMIAQCLAEGKRVLFVSEKTAALDVVYRRLKEIGLGSYCLELHSNKAKKSKVLEQLNKAWESMSEDPEDWDRESKKLAGLKKILNDYVERLHKKYPNGLTPYKAIGTILKHSDFPKIHLQWESAHTHSLDEFQELEDIAKRIDINSKLVGELKDNPLEAIQHDRWSPKWQSNLIKAAKSLANECKVLAKCLKEFSHSSAIPVDIQTIDQLSVIPEVFTLLTNAYNQHYAFAFHEDHRQLYQDLKAASHTINSYKRGWCQLSGTYKNEAIFLPLDDYLTTWEDTEDSFFLKKWLERSKIRKVLTNTLKDKDETLNIVADLKILKRSKAIFDKISKFDGLKLIISSKWDGLESDTQWIDIACNWYEQYQQIVSELASSATNLTDIKTAMKNLVVENNNLLIDNGIVQSKSSQIQESISNLQQYLEITKKLTDSDLSGILDDPNKVKRGLLVRIYRACHGWIAHEKKIRLWAAWQKVKEEAEGKGLSAIVHHLTNESNGHEAYRLFYVNYSRWWINEVTDNDETLCEFVAEDHEYHIREFIKSDNNMRKLSRAKLSAKLSEGIPTKENIPRDSQWSILNRELQKKKRHLPLRQLINRMPDVIPNLTPCVMMSPMSIAQYLSADSQQFDVVIFDEASQIPVWDAIGSIARAKQAVIVGDPKQLPPTSFFNRVDDEFADADVGVEDLESILDECIGANIPVIQLNRHYRSKSESLITFSNHNYYSGRLITFPSACTDDMSVHYQHIANGVYERGGARTNQNEAKAIVADVISKISDPEFEETIGIVTFNTEQQALIEDLFDCERRNNPDIEKHFDNNSIEPLFIKNLESVQGDERDIIYFSITYGPDHTGAMSMNFGPLNQQGGPRRLNVAITRARSDMYLFTSLEPEQIDLSRTSAEGVRDLKHFMRFARDGINALGDVVGAPIGGYDSPFEEAVAERLKKKGWELHSQIGVSKYRIDLGVVNPLASGAYLAGIECDGATYHRSETARDRDLLREQVLRSKGWEIIRIWSTDWWTDADAAIQKVHDKLKMVLAEQSNKLEK